MFTWVRKHDLTSNFRKPRLLPKRSKKSTIMFPENDSKNIQHIKLTPPEICILPFSHTPPNRRKARGKPGKAFSGPTSENPDHNEIGSAAPICPLGTLTFCDSSSRPSPCLALPPLSRLFFSPSHRPKNYSIFKHPLHQSWSPPPSSHPHLAPIKGIL